MKISSSFSIFINSIQWSHPEHIVLNTLIYPVTHHDSCSFHLSYPGNQDMTKALMNNLREILFWEYTDCWDHNISVSLRVDFDHFNLKIVVVSYPIKTLMVNKITMLQRFRFNLLKTNIRFEVTQWDGVVSVTWTVINCSHWMYSESDSKPTSQLLGHVWCWFQRTY